MSSEEAQFTKLELKILTCARDAGITAGKWYDTFEAVGAEKIVDIQELHQEDFNKCNFEPLLQRRIENFQARLWSHQPGLMPQ